MFLMKYTLRGLERYSEALECYNKVLIIDPNELDTLVNKGVILNDLKRYSEALVSYDKAMIKSLSRIEGSAPSETSLKSRPVEIYCEDCRTVLTERENPKFCPLCGSSNLSEKTI